MKIRTRRFLATTALSLALAALAVAFGPLRSQLNQVEERRACRHRERPLWIPPRGFHERIDRIGGVVVRAGTPGR